MYLLFSRTESRADKGDLDMRCDAALANYLFVRCLSFRSCSYIRFSLVLICLNFNLTFLNGGCLRSWLEQC